jgi:phosphomannomutase/phosphoglucomutase
LRRIVNKPTAPETDSAAMSAKLATLRLFGTSGIRGFVNRTLTPDFAAKMGLCFAHLLGREGIVAVGMDVRLHAAVVQKAVISGLNAGGVDVRDCGVVPTPAVLHFIRREKLGGAVVVTGSHAIPPVIGLLFFQADGGEMSFRHQKRLESLYFQADLRPNPWNRLGTTRPGEAIEAYQESIFRLTHSSRFEGRRVVVDPGNGAASGVIGPILEEIGCRVSAINDTADGRFPSRPPYPRREVLKALKQAVKETSADLGVATDGDGDRAIFVDERGEVAWGDVTGSLFAQDRLQIRSGGTIVAPVNSSQLINDVCRGRGKLVTTRIGPPAIIEALRTSEDTIFGFEETGKYIWPEDLLYGDSSLSTARMLELMERRGMTLRELTGTLPRYHMVKRAFRCADSSKMEILGRILRLARGGKAKVITLDGVKMIYPDRSWVLLRPSGTEPFFRCYAEARTAEMAEELARSGVKILREASSSIRTTAR